jgi:hypothetical protein
VDDMDTLMVQMISQRGHLRQTLLFISMNHQVQKSLHNTK